MRWARSIKEHESGIQQQAWVKDSSREMTLFDFATYLGRMSMSPGRVNHFILFRVPSRSPANPSCALSIAPSSLHYVIYPRLISSYPSDDKASRPGLLDGNTLRKRGSGICL